jgi:hypothetical protein
LIDLEASYHLFSTNTPAAENSDHTINLTKRKLFEETCSTSASAQLLQTNVLNLSNKFKLINYNNSNGQVANSESNSGNLVTLKQESFFKTAYMSSCRTASKNKALRSRCIPSRSDLILDAPDVNDDYCMFQINEIFLP